ncbi:hypothetical protein C2S52_008302 [Perilla frutescens var. hirtella]|nr:hypothetical protein C2S52_008302 [Perilla frutescens var. hirtella]
MVVFKDITISGRKHLVILDDKEQRTQEGTLRRVHEPLIGEMSISLWDIHVLSVLPINGELYDKVIPCTKELIGIDQDNKLYVSASCKHLFHDYHLFLEKKTVRPKSTHNPTGNIKVHETWTIKEKISFEKLDVKERYVNQTYLATYLSCWLCNFILPEDNANLIRPETFKMSLSPSKQYFQSILSTAGSGDSTSRVYFPSRPSSAKNLLSMTYKNWWDLVRRNFSNENVIALILPQTDVECQKLVAKVDSLSEKRKTHLDLDNNSISSNAERHWKRQKRHEKPAEDYTESGHVVVYVVEVAKERSGATDLENNHDSAKRGQSLQQSGKPTKIRSTPPLGEMSKFNGQALYDTHHRTFLKGFWSDLQSKILRTTTEFISSIKEDVLGVISSIRDELDRIQAFVEPLISSHPMPLILQAATVHFLLQSNPLGRQSSEMEFIVRGERQLPRHIPMSRELLVWMSDE